jgi:hypothetical protein
MHTVLLSLALVGCHNLEGEWEGSCGDLELELVIDTDFQGAVYGSAVAWLTVGGATTEAPLDLEGTREGPDFDLELDSAGWVLNLDGTHQDGVLEGDCELTLTVLGFEFAETGSLLLEPGN